MRAPHWNDEILVLGKVYSLEACLVSKGYTSTHAEYTFQTSDALGAQYITIKIERGHHHGTSNTD